MAKAKKYSRDALDAVSARINKNNSISDGTFKIGAPCMVTVFGKTGRYRNEGMLGGEEFKFDRTYVGSSGAILFCFKPTRPSDYATIEISNSKLAEKLPEFDELLTEQLGGVEINEYLLDYSSVYSEKEEKAALKSKQESYGENWGMF